jgi:hypothetical protein
MSVYETEDYSIDFQNSSKFTWEITCLSYFKEEIQACNWLKKISGF